MERIIIPDEANAIIAERRAKLLRTNLMTSKQRRPAKVGAASKLYCMQRILDRWSLFVLIVISSTKDEV